MKVVGHEVAESTGISQSQAAELEVIYRYAPIGLGVYDRDLRVLRVNDALAKFHDLCAVEHIGQLVEEVAPEFGKEIAKCLRKVFASGEPVLNVEKHKVSPGQPAIEREFLASYYP